jgi:hypothetical protein
MVPSLTHSRIACSSPHSAHTSGDSSAISSCEWFPLVSRQKSSQNKGSCSGLPLPLLLVSVAPTASVRRLSQKDTAGGPSSVTAGAPISISRSELRRAGVISSVCATCVHGETSQSHNSCIPEALRLDFSRFQVSLFKPSIKALNALNRLKWECFFSGTQDLEIPNMSSASDLISKCICLKFGC